MNDLRSPPARGGPDRHPEDLDGLLRRFFRSEMPDPWPAAPPLPRSRAALPPRKRQIRRPWFPFSMRFAVAASVALLVIGYLALAGRFSSQGSDGRTVKPRSDLAEKSGSNLRPPSLKGLKRPDQRGSERGPTLRLLPRTVPGQDGSKILIQGTSRPTPRGPAYEFNLDRIR